MFLLAVLCLVLLPLLLLLYGEEKSTGYFLCYSNRDSDNVSSINLKRFSIVIPTHSYRIDFANTCTYELSTFFSAFARVCVLRLRSIYLAREHFKVFEP